MHRPIALILIVTVIAGLAVRVARADDPSQPGRLSQREREAGTTVTYSGAAVQIPNDWTALPTTGSSASWQSPDGRASLTVGSMPASSHPLESVADGARDLAIRTVPNLAAEKRPGAIQRDSPTHASRSLVLHDQHGTIHILQSWTRATAARRDLLATWTWDAGARPAIQLRAPQPVPNE